MGKSQSKIPGEYELESTQLLNEGSRSDLNMIAEWEIHEGTARKLGKSLTVFVVTMHSTLTGALEDGAYYQTWFTFPLETGDETFTCTMQYNASGNEFYGINNYEGDLSHEWKAGRTNYVTSHNDSDLVDTSDWDFAGWRHESDFEDIQEIQIPENVLAPGELGCTASRIFSATGGLLGLIEKYYKKEVNQIRKFDWTQRYKVQSGWKKWSNERQSVPTGANANAFNMVLDCADCPVDAPGASMSGATMIAAATTLATAAMLSF